MRFYVNQIFDLLFKLIILYGVSFHNFVKNDAKNSQFLGSEHVLKMDSKNPAWEEYFGEIVLNLGHLFRKCHLKRIH